MIKTTMDLLKVLNEFKTRRWRVYPLTGLKDDSNIIEVKFIQFCWYQLFRRIRVYKCMKYIRSQLSIGVEIKYEKVK